MLNIYPRDVVNLRDEQNNTLLMIAAKMGSLEVIQLLLDNWMDINAQNVSVYSVI